VLFISFSYQAPYDCEGLLPGADFRPKCNLRWLAMQTQWRRPSTATVLRASN